jgi:protein-tyrosine kinase
MTQHYFAASLAPVPQESGRPAEGNLRQPSDRNLNIGRILLEKGKLTPEDAERVMLAQKETGMRFGEAAQHLGLVSEQDIQEVLALQFDYPYLQRAHSGFSEQLVAAYRPFSPQVEKLRAVRSQLMLRWFSDNRRSLVVVGVDHNEGMSVFTANLAVVFSQLGESTLLVDANMRAPSQQKMFGLSNHRGLSDHLAGRSGELNFTKIDAFVDLTVLTAGATPPNPQELLSRESFTKFAASVEQHHDIVLYDASAFNTAADALIVASRVGGALIVVQQEKTRIADINLVCEQFVRNGVEVVGIVMAHF